MANWFRPFTTLLKKDAISSFKWTPEADATFVALQNALVMTLVLTMPDFNKPFFVECDASCSDIGAVLMQEGKPLAYFHKALSDHARTISVYEKELMALVFAIQHWRLHLLGWRFLVCTDHRSFRHLLHQKIATPAQQLWVAKLLGYDFTVEYKTGVTNTAADSLSQQEEGTFMAISRAL